MIRNKKLFGVLNAIDVILIVIIIITIAGGIYKFVLFPRGDGEEETDLRLKIMCSYVPEFARRQISVTNMCAEHERGGVIGYVEDVTQTGDGIALLIAGKGKQAENGFIIGGELYLIAQDLKLRIGNVLINGMIEEIYVKQD